RDRRVRGLQRAPAVRDLQRRSASLRTEVQPDYGRRLRCARPSRSGYGSDEHARVPERGGVHDQPAQRSGAAPTQVPRLPPEPEVDGAGQGKGPLEEKKDRLPVAVPTDEIYEKYLQKAIGEINDLADEIARAAGDAATVLGSGHPLADVMLLKYSP